MQSVKTDFVEKLDKKFDKILKEMPEKRRELHEELAVFAETTVRSNLGGSKVKNWQQGTVGSGGGYAAVRAERKQTYKNYNVGYITNAVNNGHAVRTSNIRAGTQMGSRGKRLRNGIRKVKSGWVKGRFFYQQSQDAIEKKAHQLVERTVAEFEGEFKGI